MSQLSIDKEASPDFLSLPQPHTTNPDRAPTKIRLVSLKNTWCLPISFTLGSLGGQHASLRGGHAPRSFRGVKMAALRGVAGVGDRRERRGTVSRHRFAPASANGVLTPAGLPAAAARSLPPPLPPSVCVLTLSKTAVMVECELLRRGTALPAEPQLPPSQPEGDLSGDMSGLSFSAPSIGDMYWAAVK